MDRKLENYRITKGPWGTKPCEDFGAFKIPVRELGGDGWSSLHVVCAPMESEWQHVSVSHPNRCPYWNEMHEIKRLFWGDGVTVFQFHPKQSEYVNNHPYCLHMWKHRDREIELPPSHLVGFKNLSREQ